MTLPPISGLTMPGAWFSRDNAKYCSMVRVSTSTPAIVPADIESILYADPSLEINNVKVKLIGLHECINSVPIPTRTLDLSSREFSTTKEKKYYRVRSRLVLILEKESSVEGLIATIQRFRFEESLAGFAAALAVLIYGASQSRNTRDDIEYPSIKARIPYRIFTSHLPRACLDVGSSRISIFCGFFRSLNILDIN
ncbi:hypothetical protein Tco_0664003 [Tanacetum coccineum]